jgi:hypothetical protein
MTITLGKELVVGFMRNNITVFWHLTLHLPPVSQFSCIDGIVDVDWGVWKEDKSGILGPGD